MIYLILSIIFSTSLFVIFKYFEIYKIHTLKAIVINYIVAFLIGFTLTESELSVINIRSEPWFYGALILGLLFITVFLIMAFTAQKNGVSVASVAGKMSVVIPILFGIFIYDETSPLLKILGILLALVAVYLTSVKDKKNEVSKSSNLLYPILLFFGSGIIDTIIKYVETNFVKKEDVDIFSGSLFGFAAFFGMIILIVHQFKNRESFGLKNLIAGILLGIPNYYSIVFLIKALQTEGIESSTLFTINNIGIVVVSTLVGLLLFKEQFNLKNKIGIILAISGITLVAIA